MVTLYARGCMYVFSMICYLQLPLTGICEPNISKTVNSESLVILYVGKYLPDREMNRFWSLFSYFKKMAIIFN